jgi:hypothetical protein
LNAEYLATPISTPPGSPKLGDIQLPGRTKKPKQTFSLTSNKFQDTRSASPRPGRIQLPGRDESNEWIKLDSLSMQLGALLGVGPGDFASMCHKRNLSFILALDTFLSAFEQERPFDMLLFQPPLDTSVSPKEARSQLLENLAAVLPADPFTQPDSWRRFLSGANGNIERAIELAQLYVDFSSKEGAPTLVDLVKNLPDLPAPPSIAKESQEWSVVKRIEILAHPSSASSGQCSRLANEYRARAMDARREAARHAQTARGGASLQSQGERAAAMHWSERSLFFMKRGKEWAELAAQHLIAERQCVHSTCLRRAA